MKNLISIVIGLFLVSPAFAWKATTLAGPTTTIKMEVDVAPTSSQLDILFVVDNSGSMEIHQQTLVNNINALIGGLVKFDVHAAVVTTDMVTGQGHFSSGILTSKDADFVNNLKNNILKTGVNGDSVEQLFAPVIAALTPPLSLTTNKGFLRDQANLVVVFLTDADDQSQMSAEDFTSSLKAIKANTAGSVSLVALYIPTGMESVSCQGDSPDGSVKFEKALTAFQAKTAFICDAQLSKSLTDIGNLLTGGMGAIERKIKLPMAPVLNTVKVTYGPSELQMGDMYQGWMYDSKNTMLWIGEEFDFTKEPAGTKLLIEYSPKDLVK